MASIRIEKGRSNYSIYYVDRNGELQHKSSGVPHHPSGTTTEERAIRVATNRRIAQSMANDLELAENGPRSTPYIKALFNACLQRAMGIYSKDGTNGLSIRGWLEAWLKLQTHLNEGRKGYQCIINSFCDYLGERQTDSLLYLDPRHTQEFIASQAGFAASTINNKLNLLENAFEDAVRRGFMLYNIISEEDYLDEKRLRRKPFTQTHFAALYERWNHLAKTDAELGPKAAEWITASKFGRYQGMRIGDATNQVRGNIDFGVENRGFVTWMPEKTEHLKRIVILPLHSEVSKQLLPMEHFANTAKLTPLLAALKRPELCTQFKKELVATGIDPEDFQLKDRVFAAYTFHSHKHHYVDCLDKALVDRDRRKLLAAHSSDEASEKYRHPWTREEAEVLRMDIEKVQ